MNSITESRTTGILEEAWVSLSSIFANDNLSKSFKEIREWLVIGFKSIFSNRKLGLNFNTSRKIVARTKPIKDKS